MSGKPAARVTDPTVCPVPGHATNSITSGSPDVFIGGLQAARQNDLSACGSTIVGNVSKTVLINGLPAATVGSTGTHGNVISGGCGTVIIGDSFASAPSEESTPSHSTNTFARKFAVTDSHTGEPLANRKYIAFVDGRRREGKTDASGMAYIEAPSANSEIELHVIFRAPARELTEFSGDSV